MIRVAIADDHTLVRDGIRTLLELAPDLTVVGEAGDGAAAVALVLAESPDVLVLDMRMPRGDGRWVVTELAQRRRLPPTLVLTTFDDDAAALAIVRAGARGFLLKDVTRAQLVDAVRALAAGATMIRPALTSRGEGALATRGKALADAHAPLKLTPREHEVLRLVAGGFSNREIAGVLDMTEGTAKNHVSNILAKLGVRDRTRAALKAAEHGLL
jgi:DNA-binding NarL/FixJ family response regulator